MHRKGKMTHTELGKEAKEQHNIKTINDLSLNVPLRTMSKQCTRKI